MELHRLGKYEIVGKIGQGAMGEVFKAHDPILNRDVAIKTMSAAIGADDELRKRFHREAQSAARLNHPNIITVYDFGEEQGKIYMAMELLEGHDLKDVIGRHTPLTLEQKVTLIEQITEGLAFAHAKDVVHRDLKPANIHIQPNGQVKIMDFGLAKLASSDMTRAGMIMGTPNYMSPEQVRGEKADSRSDVFSLGAVFYELLANRKPFEADSLHAVLFQVMQNEPEALMKVVPDIPPALAQVVERAMAKDNAARYRDAGEMREAVRQVRAQMSSGWAAPDAPSAIDATVIGAYNPALQAPAPPRAPQSWPPSPAPGSQPPMPVRAYPPAPAAAHGNVDVTTLQPPPGYAAPGHHEVEATTLQPPPSGYDVEATTVQPPPARRSHPGTPLPVARPVPPPARVEGQLAVEHRPGDARTPTLSGHAPTHLPAPVPPPAAPRAPRPIPPPVDSAPRPPRASAGPPMPLLIGGGVLVVVLAIGGYFAFRGGSEPEVAPSTQPGTGDPALLKQLLDSQALLAKKTLEDKDFRAASKQAQEILAKDPNHPVAKEVLAGAERALQDVEAAVNATRQALEGGDMKAASENLSRIFALDPTNPAATEFSTRLNQYFRAQAEAARSEMTAAQRQASRTRQASTQAEFGAASAVARDAESLFGRGEFAQATRKFMESRDGFERARRAAERAAAAPPSVAPPTTLAVAPTTMTAATMAEAPTPAPPPTPTGSGDEGAIRELVAQYERAIETRDVGLLKTLKPDLSGKEQDALRRAAANDVRITVGTLQLNGDKATVMCARTDRLGDGKSFNIQQTLILAKKGGRWVIQRIVSQQISQ
jgi:serine/threonine-protein kinase